MRLWKYEREALRFLSVTHWKTISEIYDEMRKAWKAEGRTSWLGNLERFLGGDGSIWDEPALAGVYTAVTRLGDRGLAERRQRGESQGKPIRFEWRITNAGRKIPLEGEATPADEAGSWPATT